MSELTHALRQRLAQKRAGLLPAGEPVASDEEVAAMLAEYDASIDTQQERVADLRGAVGRLQAENRRLRTELARARGANAR